MREFRRSTHCGQYFKLPSYLIALQCNKTSKEFFYRLSHFNNHIHINLTKSTPLQPKATYAITYRSTPHLYVSHLQHQHTMDYLRIYEEAGNVRDGNGGMHIPIFACGYTFGHIYASSVSYGLSKIFTLKKKPDYQAVQEVYIYLLDVCAEGVAQENCHGIYEHVVLSLARNEISVFAMSYKHRMSGGPQGRRQRLSLDDLRQMSTEIVRHAQASSTDKFCFWLDQILGQRKPSSERRWVENGLLPYAVFETIVMDYGAEDLGAWLRAEKLLASGMSNSARREASSTIIKRHEYDGGGPDSLMRAASAIACGAIDNLRGNVEDKKSIVNWALETLDMSNFMKGNQIEHFNRVFYKKEPWNKERLSSIMFNLDILPGALSFENSQRHSASWGHEAELLSHFIPQDLKQLCDGSYLSRGKTEVFATLPSDKFVYLQVIFRNMRPRLVITALVSEADNKPSNRIEAFTALSFNEHIDPHAKDVNDRRLQMIEWARVKQFLRPYGVRSSFYMSEFTGKWNF